MGKRTPIDDNQHSSNGCCEYYIRLEIFTTLVDWLENKQKNKKNRNISSERNTITEFIHVKECV